MKVDLWSEWAIENGAAPRWQWVHLEAIEHTGPGNFNRLVGAVYSARVKTGPRAGRVNFKKPDPGTKREFIIDHDQWLKWRVEYLAKRGLCVECEGEGRLFTSWKIDGGTTYKPCPKACVDVATLVLFEPAKAAGK